MARGTVKRFDAHRRVGAISSADLPPGCDAWFHCSMIHGTGPRTPVVGQEVEFQHEAVPQGSFRHRATSVVLLPPAPPPARDR